MLESIPWLLDLSHGGNVGQRLGVCYRVETWEEALCYLQRLYRASNTRTACRCL